MQATMHAHTPADTMHWRNACLAMLLTHVHGADMLADWATSVGVPSHQV